MNKIQDEKKKELFELVEKQKKAKINWVAVITQLSEEDIKTIAWEIGLVIDKDLIMLPSETEEGKKELQIQKNMLKIIDQALKERVLRNYIGGETKSSGGSAYDFSGADNLGGLIATVALAGVVAAIDTQSGSTTQKQMTIGDAETFVCNLDGTIDYSFTKADQKIPAIDHLYQDMKKQHGENLHFLVPLKDYYKLVFIPRNDDKLRNEGQKKRILSLCELLDYKIKDFCEKIVQQSIVEFGKQKRKKDFSVLLITGEKIEVLMENKIGGRKVRYIQDYIQINELSLFLSYRTHLNQLYYEMTQTKQIPSFMEFVLNNQLSNQHFLEKNIQQLFQEFIDRIVSKGLTENAEIIKSILNTL